MSDLKVFMADDHGHGSRRGNPDRPERMEFCRAALEAAGALPEPEAAPATLEQIGRVHSRDYLEQLESFCREGGGWIWLDTFADSGSFEAVRRYSGAACAAATTGLAGVAGVALGRPPGHHSGRDSARGFCLVNHAAVAASFALDSGAPLVMVVDLDVHHGNGTQDIFWSDPQVVYVSVHQWPLYPGTGPLEDIGEGRGRGSTVNVPLPARSSDGDYLEVLDRIILPVARAVDPRLVLVSLGFDAHVRDPMGGMTVTAAGYAEMARRLLSLSEEGAGGIAFVLEGGYEAEGVTTSLAAVLQAIQGTGPAPPPVGATSPAVERAAGFHAAVWGIA